MPLFAGSAATARAATVLPLTMGTPAPARRQFLSSHAETEKEFTDYVEQCRELALYDTGVTATYGDKLLTLSTCEYSNTNGRLVVVAKKI